MNHVRNQHLEPELPPMVVHVPALQSGAMFVDFYANAALRWLCRTPERRATRLALID